MKLRLDPGASALLVHAVGQTERPKEFPWNQMSRIAAIKRDLFGVDLVCLLIELDAGGLIELDESMENWSALLNVLPSRLPGAMRAEDWLPKVLFPAFRGQPLVVYRR